MDRFCICPGNADAIARKIVDDIHEPILSLNEPLARLSRGKDEYRLSFQSVEDLKRDRDRLASAKADIEAVLEIHEARHEKNAL